MGAVNNIHTHLNLNSNEIRDVRLEHLESDPAAASGRLYYNSETREVRYSDGEKWHSLNVGIWSIDEDGNIVASGDVIIDGNLIVKGDTASGGTGQNTPGGGGVTEEDVKQYLTDYVNSITTTGSGNVISSVSKNGKIITFNKGIAALTSQGGTINGELKVNNTVTVNSLKVWDGGSNVATLLMDGSSLSINKELKLTNGGSVDISSGVAAAFKTNYAQIKSLIANDIYIGAANSGTTSNLAFNIKTYKGISSQAPANAATVFSVDVNGNVTANGSLSADLNWNDILYNKPTTLAGYGITDAYILSGTITLGSKSIKPLTTHQTIHSLTIKNSLGTTLTTYTPNSAAQSITLGKAMVGLGSVENTALSTWSGTSNITTLGTITSGTWKGSAIANTYLANSSITIAGTSVSLGGSIETSTITAAQIGSGNSFVHSGNIASQNVASAKKLATSVNIWGKSFDGSSDITGHLYLNNEAAINCKTTDGTNRKVLLINAANHLFVGPDLSGVGNTFITGNSIYFRYGASKTEGVKLTSSGNFLIGTTSDNGSRLRVAGNAYINGLIEAANAKLSSGLTITSGGASIKGDVTIDGNLIVKGDTSSGGTGQDTPSGGVMDETQLKEYLVKNNYIDENELNKVISALNLSQYATTLSLSNAISSLNLGQYVTTTALNSALSNYVPTTGGSFSGEISALNYIITNTGTGYHLQFKRGGGNIIWCPSGGYYRIVCNGAGTSDGDATLLIKSGTVSVKGNLSASGTVSQGSDIRFKDIIEHKMLKIEDIANAPCFSFKWNNKEDDSIHLGTSAQYWESIAPELVSGKDFKTLNYASLGVAMGIALSKKSINHEDRIKMLEDEIQVLNQELRRI